MKNARGALIALSLLAGSLPGGAGDWIRISSADPRPAAVGLIRATADSSVIHFELSGFLSEGVRTPRGEARVIRVDRATPILARGAPDLPKLTGSVIIPDAADMKVDILAASFTEYEGVAVAPSKGNLSRDVNPEDIPYSYGLAYDRDGFFPGQLAELRPPHIVRAHRGQTVVVYPFQYNPVTGTLRVYYDLTVSVSPTGRPGLNPLLRPSWSPGAGDPFGGVYPRLFMNGGNLDSGLTDEPGPMLIISDGAFLDALAPFVEWKESQGFDVTLADAATIGDAAAVKAFIADLYRTKGLAYVLLVGDAARMPPSSMAAGDSDNDYAYVAGDDHYPDLCVGRFSAERIDEVQTQVRRSMAHETALPRPVLSLAWGAGIASSLGPGDDDEMDFEHIRKISVLLQGEAFMFCFELFDGSQGGTDAAGNPSSESVAQAVNVGAELVNYAGHGSRFGWGTSGFDVDDIGSLSNIRTHPVIWSVACKNGDFAQTTCFAEAWLRASHNGEPAGAAAFLGSTINQSWDPPMCGQDAMNALLAEACADGRTCRFGPISMAGCMRMNDEYGPYGEAMTDAWTCFGDPSLIIFPHPPGFPSFSR